MYHPIVIKPRKRTRHRRAKVKGVHGSSKVKISRHLVKRRAKGLPLKPRLIVSYDPSSPLLAMKIRRIARKLANDPQEAEDIAFVEAMGASVSLDD